MYETSKTFYPIMRILVNSFIGRIEKMINTSLKKRRCEVECLVLKSKDLKKITES